jgi:orotate phosphoribosyltransferase-like protein
MYEKRECQELNAILGLIHIVIPLACFMSFSVSAGLIFYFNQPGNYQAFPIKGI